MTLKSLGGADFNSAVVSISTTGNSLKQFYDRNSLNVPEKYQSAPLAPHVTTQRWAYTVPANRKAFVTAMQTNLTRVTAAAPVGSAQAWIAAYGGSLVLAFCESRTNNVGDQANAQLSPNMLLVAGDSMQGYTIDTSTGGTVEYSVLAAISEFDA